ncbi:hypothetical protein GLAREA_08618 [Glarea lozoyensis ATCC 20868]|uniref:Uncharacterized protein n=1 Tax=Glarea lozoyensis (strain ATCC 20868 / MF5171) TaxID=1116229 RepID=S3CFT6_GLAL2|nr:uncharacterized protein GLAREA_08618 [Glarea lozoyensis ATCC 20868]EPE24765.1 hypothetical protein GLAREA_08618 [Glarea lozoyensis ATCC 20868]
MLIQTTTCCDTMPIIYQRAHSRLAKVISCSNGEPAAPAAPAAPAVESMGEEKKDELYGQKRPPID